MSMNTSLQLVVPRDSQVLQPQMFVKHYYGPNTILGADETKQSPCLCKTYILIGLRSNKLVNM